jgi:hypothetical protein
MEITTILDYNKLQVGKNEVDYDGDRSLLRMWQQNIRQCGDLPAQRITTTLFQFTEFRYDCRASLKSIFRRL